MGEQYTPTLALTVKSGGVITRRRFVGFDKIQVAVAGKQAFGVAQQDAVLDDLLPVTVLGSAIIEAGGVIAVGDSLAADAQGRAVVAANLVATVDAGVTAVTSSAVNGAIITLAGSVRPEKINAIAMEAAGAAGDMIEVLLVK